jgi:lauroyl/myristoyl acyltransferase
VADRTRGGGADPKDAPLWASYCGARLMALGLPPSEIEQAGEARAASMLRHCLGMGPDDAAYHARRCVLYRRESVLHEFLAINLVPHSVAQILDQMEVVGLDRLRGLGRGRGLVLVSLHYCLHSSLLGLWLARATARGLFDDLTMLVVSDPTGALRPSHTRLKQLEQADVWDLAKTTLLDRRLVGSPWSARRLVSRAKDGGTVLLLPDAVFLRAAEEGALRLNVGCRAVGVPQGAAWVAQSAGVPVVPVHVRPHEDDRHAIVFGCPAYPQTGANSTAPIRDALQGLLDRTVLADPAPWQGWLREGFAQASGVPDPVPP